MQIYFNNSLVNDTNTISMVNDFSNQTYQILCAAIGSKPDVVLTLYDKNSLIPLSTTMNSVIRDTCTSMDLCTYILQVNFQFTDNRFNNMTSLACSANSTNVNVPLYSVIYRNTSVAITSIDLN